MIPSVVLIVGLLVAVAWPFLKLFHFYQAASLRALERIYAEVGVNEPPGHGEPLVEIEFYTHHGLLFWTTETKHQLTLPYEKAGELLRRLHRFNLKWGILAYGALFIPFISLFNCWSQRRRMRRQMERVREERLRLDGE
jgi:hypothetical protein